MGIAGRRRGRWVRVDAGPDDAAERVVDNRLVGSGLGDDRVRRRREFSGGAGLLRDCARIDMRVILRTDGAADIPGPGSAFGVDASVLTFLASIWWRTWVRRHRREIRERTHCWTVDELLDAVQLTKECLALPSDLRLFFGGGSESGAKGRVFLTQATHLYRSVALFEFFYPVLERRLVIL